MSLLKDPVGKLIVPTSAVRGEGTSRKYCRTEFPAVADHCLVDILATESRKTNEVPSFGIVWTEDDYYCLLKDRQAYRAFGYWQKRHVLAAEMECSAFFVVAALRRIKAAAILVVNRTFAELESAAARQNVRWRIDIENRIRIAAKIAVSALAAKE